MKTIKLLKLVGSFAENKDVAKEIKKEIISNIGNGVVLDFEGVDSATQSFVHAMISDIIRDGNLDKLSFKNCSETVKKIIILVTDYMQESVM